ncbi:MAG TPA: Hint domain-containing protein [Bradyrhizobium sp.]|nr:Hint domain-containing protein [Bradyrhizobium sp.]
MAKTIVLFSTPTDLWVTDGTAAGTVELTALNLGSAELNPLTVFNGQVFFDGLNASNQTGLWATDGTVAGTHEVTGISGANSSGLDPHDLTVFNGEMLFAGSNASGAIGLWASDGTGGGTHELTGISGAYGNGLDPTYLTVFNGEVLFKGVNSHGVQGLWVTDGTATGTHELTGISGAAVPGPFPTPPNNGLAPSELTVFSGKVYFAGTSLSYQPVAEEDLWVTDGTAAGTHAITGISGTSPYGVRPGDLTAFNNELLFSGSDSSGKVGLWVSDGTGAGTHELTGITGTDPYTGLNPNNMTVFNNEVIFQAPDSNLLSGLWVTDGTAAGTHELTGITGANTSGFGLDPWGFTVANDKVLFEALDSTGQNGLWETDGTAAGTHELLGVGGNLTGAEMAVLQVACYCPGTLIRTELGETRVETLKIGDRVATKSGAARPIKWIGRRSYGGRFIMGRREILPVCIKAGALDDDVPKRDLWISPHHAMYLGGVLIEAKDLVNGASIVQAERVDEVEYFHIELESHDVIYAEGALSETFVDDDSRGMFYNAHEYAAIYPDEERTPAFYCAPRLDSGSEVETMRRRLAARAGIKCNRAPKIGGLRGFIDVIRPDQIAGWAQNVDHPEAPVCLDIHAGGRVIGQVLANGYRADLEGAGLGSGCHGFAFAPPAGLAVDLTTIEVRRTIDGSALARIADARAMRPPSRSRVRVWRRGAGHASASSR